MKRANNFNFLRLFAAFSVVIAHAVSHMGLSFFWMSKGNPYWIYDGVSIFFIISGYLVYTSCERCIERGHPIGHFMANRFLRLAPAIYGYLIVTVISLLVTGLIKGSDLLSPSFLGWMVSTIFLVPVYHPPEFSNLGVGVLNGSLWTIPAELSFYLVLPFIVWGFRKIKARMFVILAILAIIGVSLHWVYLSSEYFFVKLLQVSFIPYLIFFSLGIFWAKLWNKVPHHPVIFVGCMGFYLFLRWTGVIYSLGPVDTILWAIPLSYALIWFAYYGGSFFRKITEKIGDLSYGLYIWHMVVINFLMYFKIYNIWAVIALTFVLAFLSWWLIEKRALVFKPYTTVF